MQQSTHENQSAKSIMGIKRKKKQNTKKQPFSHTGYTYLLPYV